MHAGSIDRALLNDNHNTTFLPNWYSYQFTQETSTGQAEVHKKHLTSFLPGCCEVEPSLCFSRFVCPRFRASCKLHKTMLDECRTNASLTKQSSCRHPFHCTAASIAAHHLFNQRYLQLQTWFHIVWSSVVRHALRCSQHTLACYLGFDVLSSQNQQ